MPKTAAARKRTVRVPKITRGHKAQVLKYLEGNANRIVFSGDIASDLGLTKPQVQSAINNIKNQFNGQLEMQGNGIYMWHHNATRPLFEQVGHLKSGKLLLESEDGKLYTAQELEG